jgi:hypothetical protein
MMARIGPRPSGPTRAQLTGAEARAAAVDAFKAGRGAALDALADEVVRLGAAWIERLFVADDPRQRHPAVFPTRAHDRAIRQAEARERSRRYPPR